jgi:tRNA(fMet)-specific endonuclease VapC
MILDTNAISALFEGEPGLRETLARTRISLPVIVLGEYRFGLLGSRRRREREPDLDGLQARSDVLVIDLDTVSPYSKIQDHLKRAGTPIPTNDVWIAALAVQYKLPIVSRDRHFDLVPGVRRVVW